MTTHTIGLVDTPYRVDAMAYRTSGPPDRLAYAVLDLWGWALMRKVPITVTDKSGRTGTVWRIATVDRIDLGIQPTPRAAVRARLRRIAADWHTTDNDDAS